MAEELKVTPPEGTEEVVKEQETQAEAPDAPEFTEVELEAMKQDRKSVV